MSLGVNSVKPFASIPRFSVVVRRHAPTSWSNFPKYERRQQDASQLFGNDICSLKKWNRKILINSRKRRSPKPTETAIKNSKMRCVNKRSDPSIGRRKLRACANNFKDSIQPMTNISNRRSLIRQRCPRATSANYVPSTRSCKTSIEAAGTKGSETGGYRSKKASAWRPTMARTPTGRSALTIQSRDSVRMMGLRGCRGGRKGRGRSGLEELIRIDRMKEPYRSSGPTGSRFGAPTTFFKRTTITMRSSTAAGLTGVACSNTNTLGFWWGSPISAAPQSSKKSKEKTKQYCRETFHLLTWISWDRLPRGRMPTAYTTEWKNTIKFWQIKSDILRETISISNN